jgi:thiamine-phosphate pyrophosphorylase
MTTWAGALFIVNDRIDVALASGADGAHLGPDDLPLARARETVPPGFLLGYSTDEPAAAREAEAAGADYLGCGAVYPTSNKPDAGAAVGIDGLAAVASSVGIPVLGIGGISIQHASAIAASGACGCAVIGAVMGAVDAEEAVRTLLAPFA